LAAGAALVLAAALLTGCGYSMQGRPEVDSVRVERIRNNTTEPGLQDILYDSLAIELGKYGVRLDSGAKNRVEGSLEDITVNNLASKDGLAVHFEVNVKGNFSLVGPGDERRPLTRQSSYIVTFTTTGPLEELTSMRERAIRQAMSDLATELASSVVQGQ